MAARQLPDPELLRKLLRYEPETGKLYWLPRWPALFKEGRHGAEANCKRWNKTFAGRQAFGVGQLGYLRGKLLDQEVLAHRVAWAITYGEWPEMHLDHINGKRDDNRICNLRQASFSENALNSGKQKNNTSGYKGVFRCGLTGHWRARIRVKGKDTNLGSFKSREAAHQAYRTASQRLAGEFARSE